MHTRLIENIDYITDLKDMYVNERSLIYHKILEGFHCKDELREADGDAYMAVRLVETLETLKALALPTVE